MSHIWTVAPVALVTLAAVAPPHRPRPVASVGFWLGYLVNEFPFFAFCWLVGSTLLALGNESLGSAALLVVLALAVLTVCGLALIMWRGLLAGPVVARALSRELGLDGLNGSSVGRAGYRRGPCCGRCRSEPATCSGSRTSAMALPGGVIDSICIATGPVPRGRRC
jgi:hypothetical protein